MLNRYGFEFNGESSASHGIYVEHRPDMPVGRETVEYVEVSGRDTVLAVRTGQWENIEIPVECAYKTEKKLWNEKAWEVRRWLQGAGNLTFSDSAETFWKVKDVIIEKYVREIGKYAIFETKFICDPFEYIKAGQQETEVEDVKYNPYDIAHPIYKITGEGTCTLTVNGKIMKVTVGQNATIDTDRMLTYRQDGTMMNTLVSGNYEDLYLKPGENMILITGGFGLTVIPNWRRL